MRNLIPNKLHWLLAAAVSSALAGSALAQYRVGNDGHARDASNRIGSNSINDASGSAPTLLNSQQLGNNIVTGNITGGRQFRGDVPYSASTDFTGKTTLGASDSFIRQSSAAPYGGISQNNAQVVQPFYGGQTTAAPPPNVVQQGPGVSGYVPAPALVSRAPGDLRLGQILENPSTALPQPGQLLLPGPVDPNTQTTTVITASPLYGWRQWNPANASDLSFLTNSAGQETATNANGARLDALSLEKMRSELMQPVSKEQQNAENQQQNQQNNGLDNSPSTPLESPQNSPLSSDVNATENSNAAANINSNLRTGQGTRLRLLAPERQSTQYNALKQRLERYRAIQQMDQTQASQEYNQQLRNKKTAQQQQKAPGTPQTPGTPPQQPEGKKPTLPTVPGTPVNPPSPGAQPQPGVAPQPAQQPSPQPTAPQVPIPGSVNPAPTPAITNRPPPLQIHSLAEGVQAKGLADVLKEAEGFMKTGKFNSALEQYEMAEQVAPNNPLILLGRANAELGQSYYTRAEQHLREAFTKDQALLMGQYDLKSLLGQDRLEFLVKDLKEIARRDQKESKPVFLLAYIAYNTGNERQAAGYLDLAQKRAGSNDPLYQMLKKYWSLPQDQGTTDELNK